MHRPVYVFQWKEASTKVFMHLAWHVAVSEKLMHTSSRRHPPKAENINQGLNTSAMVCAHRLSNIDCDLQASSTRCRLMIGLCNRSIHAYNMIGVHLKRNVGQWNATSTKAGTYWSFNVCIGWSTFLSSNIRKHDQSLCSSGKWCWPMIGSINQGLNASVVACKHQEATSTSTNGKQH